MSNIFSTFSFIYFAYIHKSKKITIEHINSHDPKNKLFFELCHHHGFSISLALYSEKKNNLSYPIFCCIVLQECHNKLETAQNDSDLKTHLPSDSSVAVG